MSAEQAATVTLARNAMATRFELVLHGDNAVALRAAGEEALNEVDRLEAQLSLFRPSSEIANLNARAARQPVRVSPEVFALLRRAQRLWADTAGAFDITVGPLVRSWGFMFGSGHEPPEEDLARARECVGMHLVELNESESTVSFTRPGVVLDLGAIGKGYAIESAAGILAEAGIGSGLIHGGTSTVFAVGAPPGAEAWRIAIENDPRISTPDETLLRIPIKNQALSVSAIWGKWFQGNDQMLGHVFDPREGRPTRRAQLAVVVADSATETDALSTALLVRGSAGQADIARCRPGLRTWVVDASGNTSTLP